MAELAWACGFPGASPSSVFSPLSPEVKKLQTGKGRNGSVQLVTPLKGLTTSFPAMRPDRPLATTIFGPLYLLTLRPTPSFKLTQDRRGQEQAGSVGVRSYLSVSVQTGHQGCN